MKQVQPDVWETKTERPAPGLTTHAYLLTRPDGNVLFYNTGNPSDLDQFAELGGVAYQYLSHQDELGESLMEIRRRFDTKLGGHVRELEKFAEICTPDILFDERETHLGNIQVIPTPGHTPGSTCFLVDSPTGKRYLFTGDTLFLNADGQWTAGYIGGYSDKATLAESLNRLKVLEPDVVFSSAFSGDAGFQSLDRRAWRKFVEQAAERLADS